MSAAERLNEIQEFLPDNPVLEILNVITEPVMTQTIQDETLVANEQAAITFETQSLNTGHEAETHKSSHIINENQASEHVASAENAPNKDVYHSNTSAAAEHSNRAEHYDVLAHSASVQSDVAAAQSSALEHISKIQRTVMEQGERKSFAREVENRTDIAVAQEMKTQNVVKNDAATTKAPEAEPVQAAEADLSRAV